jgi:hypothetical protein
VIPDGQAPYAFIKIGSAPYKATDSFAVLNLTNGGDVNLVRHTNEPSEKVRFTRIRLAAYAPTMCPRKVKRRNWRSEE